MAASELVKIGMTVWNTGRVALCARQVDFKSNSSCRTSRSKNDFQSLLMQGHI